MIALRLAIAGVLMLAAAGCQNLGCAEGLEIVSYATYESDSPPGKYMMPSSGGLPNGDDSGKFKWRDSSSTGRDPKFICRAP